MTNMEINEAANKAVDAVFETLAKQFPYLHRTDAFFDGDGGLFDTIADHLRAEAIAAHYRAA